MIHLDTHVVVWLYEKDGKRLSPTALQMIESHDLAISPVVLLELKYLLEIGKISERPEPIVGYLTGMVGLHVAAEEFVHVVTAALELEWTRDPFDRLIVAQAQLAEAPLLSKDRYIRDNYKKAVW